MRKLFEQMSVEFANQFLNEDGKRLFCDVHHIITYYNYSKDKVMRIPPEGWYY